MMEPHGLLTSRKSFEPGSSVDTVVSDALITKMFDLRPGVSCDRCVLA